MRFTASYGPSLDIFFFGHLALYTIANTGLYQHLLMQSLNFIHFYRNSQAAFSPAPTTILNPSTEVEHHGEYIDILETQIGWLHPVLVDLIKQCLQNVPEERPVTEEVLHGETPEDEGGGGRRTEG